MTVYTVSYDWEIEYELNLYYRYFVQNSAAA